MIGKAEAIKLGARGLAIPQAGLRPESFAYLRGGGKVYGGPPTVVVYPDGKRHIADGRHRITLAREAGEVFVRGKMIGYGPRLGKVWEHTGLIPI